MATITAFKGLRYSTDAGKPDNLVCPPYDIISAPEQDRLAALPYNIINCEYGIIYADDTANNNRYTRARDNINEWLREGILVQDEPCLYAYEMQFPYKDGVKSLCGLYSAVKLHDFSEGIILPHEETLTGAKADRLELLRATGTNISPVCGLYSDAEGKIKPLMRVATSNTPNVSFKTNDNIRHNFWIIKDVVLTEELIEAFADRKLYIADGHHRYETALRFRDEYRRTASGFVMDKADSVMMLLYDIDDDGLVVYPTHRVVGAPHHYDEGMFIEAIQRDFFVQKLLLSDGDIESQLQQRTHGISMAFYPGKDYYYIFTLIDPSATAALLPDRAEAYRSLDVTALHTLILQRYFGIDSANMAAGSSLVYTRYLNEALQLARDNGSLAFILNPTKIRQIAEVSDAGEKMPQKSTYFAPKAVTGMVMRKFI